MWFPRKRPEGISGSPPYRATEKIAFSLVKWVRFRSSERNCCSLSGSDLIRAMISRKYPRTVEEAVETLLDELTLKEKADIARMGKAQLKVLHITFRPHIRETFGFWSGNKALMESCRILSGQEKFDIATGSAMIINGLWARLRRTHSLRAIK